VLKEIERAGIKIDCIAGTSMGSLVGAMYASGMTPAEIEKMVLSLDWDQLFDDSLERQKRSYRRKEEDRQALTPIGVGVKGRKLRVATGVLAGQRILLLFERETLPVSAITDFDQLPIPYRAVATDLNTGEPVVIDHGNLGMAMRASMSLPGIFDPTEMNGKVLLDGGLSDQVPIDVVRAMGADVVIAVDVGTPLETLGRDASLVDVLEQMTGMLTVGNTRTAVRTLGEQDLLIVPALGKEVGSGDFDKGKVALEIGDAAALAARGRIEAIAAANARPAGQPPSPVAVRSLEPPIIEFYRLDNQTQYSDAYFAERIDVPLGKPLDVKAMEEQVQRVYGIENFSLVNYEVIEEDGRTGVLIHVLPSPTGPNYLLGGLQVNDDYKGGFDANLRVGLRMAPLSRNGAEARLLLQIGSEPSLAGEYYHPLDPGNHNLLVTRGGLEKRNVSLYDSEGNNLAEYGVYLAVLQAGWVRQFGEYGALGIGLRRGTGHAELQTGDPAALPDFDVDVGEAVASLTLDRLDNLYFPRDGYIAQLGYTMSRESLGADTQFDQVDFDALAAKSFGRHSVQGGLRYHSTIDGTAPVQSLYRLGGRTKLAGFRHNELTGQDYVVLMGGYLYQLGAVLGRSAFLGGTLEYGNVWQDRDDMDVDDGIVNGSVYFGFDSWLGPLLFGFGLREGGEGNMFLEISQQF
jgi:NTE family protein